MPTWIERFATSLAALSRDGKHAIALIADVLVIPAALWCAISLRLGTIQHPIQGRLLLYGVAVVASVPIFTRMGLYRAVIRFIGPRAVWAVFVGVTVSVVTTGLLNRFLVPDPVPVTALIVYWALALIYVGASRLFGRSLLHYRPRRGDRIIIYGADVAGAQLAECLSSSGRYTPTAFVDDNPSLHGRVVNGVEVVAPDKLRQLIADEDVSTVLLAIPSQSRRRRQEILKRLEGLAVHVKTVPDIADIVAGRATVGDIRDIDVGDLLGRDHVPPNARLIDGCIQGKVVMVTGAGGSIGSELCRQIALLRPARLLLLEVSELALYNIEKELRLLTQSEKLRLEIIGLLGSTHHRTRMREILQAYGVQTIYHAAAYKHVPIVEQNVVEGIHNNVFGTWHTAEAALECRVETFVLISTDKAVNPTNVMGATKRFSEIVLQGLQNRGSHTRFCMVRFGNVLESSGSVVPLFREQIRRGGPVTVTHKEVIRYFMTIPEAAQLVLQASSMANGGDVFVLDMGKPVRIADLARRMINLMGLSVRDDANPEGDVEIVYTGLRPAEKLFEELLIGTNVTGTEHSMIMRAIEHSLPWTQVQQVLDDLALALGKCDCERSRQLLMQSVIEYRPDNDVQDLVWKKKNDLAHAELKNVTALQSRRARLGSSSGPAAH